MKASVGSVGSDFLICLSKNFRFSMLLHTEKAGVLHSRPTQNQTYNTPDFYSYYSS